MAQILGERGGVPIDIDAIRDSVRADQEARIDEILGLINDEVQQDSDA